MIFLPRASRSLNSTHSEGLLEHDLGLINLDFFFLNRKRYVPPARFEDRRTSVVLLTVRTVNFFGTRTEQDKVFRELMPASGLPSKSAPLFL